MQTHAILPSIQDYFKEGKSPYQCVSARRMGIRALVEAQFHSLKSASKRENCHSCSPISLAQQQIPTDLKSP